MFIGAKYSLERMHSYINAEQEPKPTEQGIPPAYWPASTGPQVVILGSRSSLRVILLYVTRRPSRSASGPSLLNVTLSLGWAEGSPRHIFPHQIR